jgi:Nuclear pore complex component
VRLPQDEKRQPLTTRTLQRCSRQRLLLLRRSWSLTTSQESCCKHIERLRSQSDSFSLQSVFSAALSASISTGCYYFLWFIRIVFFIHGANALKPLTNKDDLADIALTPNQRNLLGLPATPTTPASGDFHTPPRYARSAGGSSRAATVGSSPFTRSVSASTGIPLGATPGSAGSSIGAAASPLMRQAMKTGSGKRWSLGASSGFDESVFGNGAGSLPATPSPSGSTGKGGQRAVSVSLNSKWLYKRQHGGSPSSALGKYI